MSSMGSIRLHQGIHQIFIEAARCRIYSTFASLPCTPRLLQRLLTRCKLAQASSYTEHTCSLVCPKSRRIGARCTTRDELQRTHAQQTGGRVTGSWAGSGDHSGSRIGRFGRGGHAIDSPTKYRCGDQGRDARVESNVPYGRRTSERCSNVVRQVVCACPSRQRTLFEST